MLCKPSLVTFEGLSLYISNVATKKGMIVACFFTLRSIDAFFHINQNKFHVK